MRQFGSLLTQLNDGAEVPVKHFNPYLSKFHDFKGILLTPSEASETQNIFSSKDAILEIGCYFGKTLSELARQNPRENFIGLDITYKRTVKTATKIFKHNISNAQVALCEASFFLNACPPNSLKGVCIFFPDPWEKRKQKKNRLISEDFVKSLRSRLKPGAFLWFKSDHEEYFNLSYSLFLNAGFKEDTTCIQPNTIQGGPYITAFEGIFKSKKIPYYQLIAYNI